ncbi:MAG: Rap1a/Tai family immunity protein [Acetobacteraceae bacterium]
MRLALFALAGAITCGVAGGGAQAAVSRDQFPPKTTADLIALCTAPASDPLMTAAVNFCQGFAEGAVQVALAYEAVTNKGREPFCLPSPRPTHDEARSQFVAWANAEPNRLNEPAMVGLLQFLVDQYPCPHPAAAARHRTSKR